MARHFVKLKTFPALLLSLTFVWNWAGCTSLCEEIAENHNPTNVLAEKQRINENCLSPADKEEVCPMTATAFVFQERQTIQAFAPLSAVVSALSFPISFSERTALLPETRQNSPPKLPPVPLFIQHCNFRI